VSRVGEVENSPPLNSESPLGRFLAGQHRDLRPLNSGPTKLPQLRLAHSAAGQTPPVLSGATANSPLFNRLTHIAADGSVLYIQA
jgi:hypothetical protein